MNRKTLCVAACLFATFPVMAHTINYALQDAPVSEVAAYYFQLGFKHIIPEGLDHVLFIIGLCLIHTKIKPIIYQATAFTVAHTLALALSMKDVIVAPPQVIEPIIALSIVFIALENLIVSQAKPWRLILVFMFGLVHGMGFASSLNEIGLPPDTFLTSILLFNLGVEVCQVLVIAAIFSLLIQPFKNRSWYRVRIVYPISILIALISIYWTFMRVFA
jgi:HupE / UreJ protein